MGYLDIVDHIQLLGEIGETESIQGLWFLVDSVVTFSVSAERENIFAKIHAELYASRIA